MFVEELSATPVLCSVPNPDTRLSREKYVLHRGFFFSPGIFVSYTHFTYHQRTSTTSCLFLRTNVRYLHGGGFRVVCSRRVVILVRRASYSKWKEPFVQMLGLLIVRCDLGLTWRRLPRLATPSTSSTLLYGFSIDQTHWVSTCHLSFRFSLLPPKQFPLQRPPFLQPRFHPCPIHSRALRPPPPSLEHQKQV